jgi:integrase
MTKERGFGGNRMSRFDVFRMIKRRVKQAGLGASANCHTFRATGITAYLLNDGTIEGAQAIAAHESPRTTKLYDRTGDEITLVKWSGSGFETVLARSVSSSRMDGTAF